MSDLEAVLADVSYLKALEKSKTAATKAPKKNMIPDSSVRSAIFSYLNRMELLDFEIIFNEIIGFTFFSKFCCGQNNPESQLMPFYEAILAFEQINDDSDRCKEAKHIYDVYIMEDQLFRPNVTLSKSVEKVHNSLMEKLKIKSTPRHIFSILLNDIRNILKVTFYESFLKSQHFTRYCQWKDVQLNTTLSMNDFSVHRIIGRGGFGEVYGCRKLNSGKMYAMKCLDKRRVKSRSGISMAINELNILTRVSSGDASLFIVCMTYAFQTPEKLCFILDLMNGGDLNYHLSQQGVFSEDSVRFYAAELILGLEHMHERNIVYRDLKPANILLDDSGHIRISDLGLACDVSEKWPTASVGTHGYMAPEVIHKGESYAFSADWYSLGCTLYKLMMGSCPFRQHGSKGRPNDAKLDEKQILYLPETLSEYTKSFLSGLLHKKVENRLGCKDSGAVELKSHSYLESIDWEMAKRQQLTPPLVPPQGEINAADVLEIGAFDEDDVQGIKLSKEDQMDFECFDVVIGDRWQHEMKTTIFGAVNEEFDQLEQKRRDKLELKLRQLSQTMSSSAVQEGDSDPGNSEALSNTSSVALTSTTVAADLFGNCKDRTRNDFRFLPANQDTVYVKHVSIEEDVIPSWPADLLLEWWIAPEIYGCGPSDCIMESELLRLGGSFLHTWQKKHVRLFPNRLEIYLKTQQGIPLKGAESISMLDIGSIYPTFQNVNKCEDVIIVVLKSQSKIFFTSTDKIIVNQWLFELLRAFRDSSNVLSSVSRKVYWIYGIDEPKLYAKAPPSSAHIPEVTHAPNTDIIAKRKMFQRMQSFQTVITSKHMSPPVHHRVTLSPICQRELASDRVPFPTKTNDSHPR